MKIIVLIILLASLVETKSAETFRFDDTQVGQPPPNWMEGVTGNGRSKWSVEFDSTAPSKPNVLKQSGEGTFPWCIKKNISITNGFVEAKFKPISGEEDQAGGLVWRYHDADNYYVVRANALENNVVLYKVEKGKRSPLDIIGRKGGYGVEIKVPNGEWSTLRVDFTGNHFAVSLNGNKLFEVKDTTFTDAGAIGLWTKADSVTLFDDFTCGNKQAEWALLILYTRSAAYINQ